MPIVLIIAQDWLLRTTLRAELREKGIEALGMESEDEAARQVAAGAVPAVFVWEPTGKPPSPGLTALAQRVPAVVVASRMTPAPLLDHAAALLYRPVRVKEVVECVLKLLRGQPA
jgi:streptomycin 6-kinase